MTSDAITITGSNNTILLKGDADTVSVLRGSGNRITLSGTVGTMVLAGKNTTVDGTGKIGTVDTRMVGCTVTAKADHTIDNIDPGLEYFRKIAEQGRLDLGEFTQARIEKGEVGVAFLWDYNALGYRDQFVENNPDADFSVFVPEEASIQSGYCTIINSYTKRPYAAALAREYILSDEGQINLAKGYAKPVRDVELPEEVKAKMIPDEQYANARMVEDQAAWDETAKTLGTRWQEEVIAYAK